MFYLDNQSEKMNNWHILLLFRQIKIIICKIARLRRTIRLFFQVTLERTCLSVICFSVVGQLRWKEYPKIRKQSQWQSQLQ